MKNKSTSNPSWWTQSHESGWERVKAAFRRDWDQTKHDFGGKEPDTDQDVNNTIKQAAGKEAIPPRGNPTYEEAERAYRLGYGARSQYGERYSSWNDELEDELKRDWGEMDAESRRDWPRYRETVRRAWEYDE
jgi:hypothetical protein